MKNLTLEVKFSGNNELHSLYGKMAGEIFHWEEGDSREATRIAEMAFSIIYEGENYGLEPHLVLSGSCGAQLINPKSLDELIKILAAAK